MSLKQTVSESWMKMPLGQVVLETHVSIRRGACGAAHWAASANLAGFFESRDIAVLRHTAGLVGRRGPMGRPTLL